MGPNNLFRPSTPAARTLQAAFVLVKKYPKALDSFIIENIMVFSHINGEKINRTNYYWYQYIGTGRSSFSKQITDYE